VYSSMTTFQALAQEENRARAAMAIMNSFIADRRADCEDTESEEELLQNFRARCHFKGMVPR
jgi:hypothetical protein